MTPLFSAALSLQNFFTEQGWRFAVIGGIALLRWGEPRFTRDVDVTLLAGFGEEDQFIQPILSAGFRERIPDAADFAQRNRVLLVESEGGVPLDIALGGLPFESTMVERASLFEFEPGCSLLTCSAEDLIVQKLFAFRPRDVLDAETVVTRQRGDLDWSYVEAQLRPLTEVKQQPEIMELCSELRREDKRAE